jgi:NAD(P)-dependent dehydrogenase (short-subunit alcohol dehydrogenase family)
VRGGDLVVRLSGKTAVVLGGATGIGRATALLFGEHGARVIVGDINDTEGGETERRLREGGGTGLFAHVTLTSVSLRRSSV